MEKQQGNKRGQQLGRRGVRMHTGRVRRQNRGRGAVEEAKIVDMFLKKGHYHVLNHDLIVEAG